VIPNRDVSPAALEGALHALLTDDVRRAAVDKYKADYKTGCDKIAAERTRFFELLRGIPGLYPYASQANYILCKLTEKLTSSKLTMQLLEKYNIFIKDLSSKTGFEHGQFIRLAVRSKQDNDKLIKALQELL